MAEEVKVVEETIENKPVDDTQSYEYGDAAIFCSKCNETSRLGGNMINIKGGIQIPPMLVNNKDFISLGCPKCGTILKLVFVPAENPPVEDVIEVVENNDTSEESREEESVS